MPRALVTGGTRGIGLAIAHAILGGGGRVAITGRSQATVDRTAEGLASVAGDASRVAGLVADVRDRAAVDQAVADAASRFGGLDVVVNNAGVGIYKNVEALSDNDWMTMLSTNVTGPFFVSRAAIPVLRRSGGGWIINVASLSGSHPFAQGGAYCATKAALIALTESLMQELRHDNIRVSVILPGSVATGFSGRDRVDDEWKLAPDDVAEVVMDLLRHPARSLPSRVEIRPSRPRKS